MTGEPLTYTPAPRWEHAPLRRRLMARFLDAMLINLLFLPLGLLNLSYAGAVLIAVILETAALAFVGQTPGRLWSGLRVGSPGDPEASPSLVKALLRTLVAFSPFIAMVPGTELGPWSAPIDAVVLSVVAAALLVLLLASPRLFGQALQDRVAGTQAWYLRQSPPVPLPPAGTAPFPGTKTANDAESGWKPRE